MAGLAANKTKSGQAQPSTRSGNGPQTQRSLSRRVSFNESTLKQSPPSEINSVLTDIEAQRNNPPKRTSRFNICCAWTSLIVGTLTVIILVLGAISFSFFQANLPEFHFQSLSIANLEVIKAPNTDTLLSADIEVVLNATNKNGKMPVYYSSLRADLASGEVLLGTMRLPELLQNPHDFTDLKVQSVLRNMTVSEPDAKDLQTKSQKHQLLIDVVLGGNIHFVIAGQKMAGFPFKVLCHDIYQGDLDNGQTPKCQVKMTPVS